VHYPRLLILAAVVVVVAALSLAQAVLVPVALAIFFCFVLAPLVTRLERWRLGRLASVLIVALFSFALLASVGWLVGRQAVDLVARLPEYQENLHRRIALVREKVHGPFARASDVVHDLERSATGEPPATATLPATAAAPATAPVAPPTAPTASNPMAAWATDGLGTLFSALGTAAVVVLLVILMLVQRSDLRDRFIALAGGGVVVTTQALDETADRLSRYLLALTLINVSYGVAVGVGLRLIGISNGLLWGIVAASLRYVPWIGPWIAASLPILFSFATSEQFATPLLACGLFAVLELLTNMVVEPLVLPSSVGVSTTALVVSAIFWTWLWGAPGLLLATPLTICVAVMGNHVPRMRFFSVLLGDQPVLSPSLGIYQRLLVGDGEDAWNLVSAGLRGGKPAVELLDALLLPALCLAQQDWRDRVIDDRALAAVADKVGELAEELGERAPQPAAAEPRRPLRIACFADTKATDSAAAAILCSVLRRAGFDASFVVQGAGPTAIDGALEADVVCVSQIPPLSFTPLRQAYARIAARLPAAPILLGTWTVNRDPVQVRERLGADGRLQVAGTLAEMVAQVEQIAARKK